MHNHDRSQAPNRSRGGPIALLLLVFDFSRKIPTTCSQRTSLLRSESNAAPWVAIWRRAHGVLRQYQGNDVPVGLILRTNCDNTRHLTLTNSRAVDGKPEN